MNILNIIIFGTETTTQSCSVKKVFLKISQNSRENACVGISQNH